MGFTYTYKLPALCFFLRPRSVQVSVLLVHKNRSGDGHQCPLCGQTCPCISSNADPMLTLPPPCYLVSGHRTLNLPPTSLTAASCCLCWFLLVWQTSSSPQSSSVMFTLTPVRFHLTMVYLFIYSLAMVLNTVYTYYLYVDGQTPLLWMPAPYLHVDASETPPRRPKFKSSPACSAASFLSIAGKSIFSSLK